MRTALKALLFLAVCAAVGVAVVVGGAIVPLLMLATIFAVAFILPGKRTEWLFGLCLIVAVLAPWQRIPAIAGQIWFFPVAWIAAVCLVPILAKGRVDREGRALLLLGGAVALWALLGVFVLGAQATTAARWLLIWLTGMMVFATSRAPGALSTVKRWAWLASAVLGLGAVAEYVLKSNPLYGRFVSGSLEASFMAAATYRPTTSLGHPLATADVLGLLVVLVVATGLEGTVKPRATLVGAAAGAIGLLATGGRSAMVVTLICVMLVLLSPRVHASRRSAYLLGATGVLVAGYALVGDAIVARFTSLVDSASAAQRLAGLSTAADVVRTSPLFGMGAGYGGLALADRGYRFIQYETEYAGLAIGLGLPGLILVLMTPIVALVRAWARLPVAHRLASAAFAIYAIGIIGTHNVFEWWPGGVLYWTCISLVAGEPNAESTEVAA